MIQYSSCFHMRTDQWPILDYRSVNKWKQEEYCIIGQMPNNKLYQILADGFVLNLKKWKNSRCHFCYWYSIIGHEVIRFCQAPWSTSPSEYDPLLCVIGRLFRIKLKKKYLTNLSTYCEKRMSELPPQSAKNGPCALPISKPKRPLYKGGSRDCWSGCPKDFRNGHGFIRGVGVQRLTLVWLFPKSNKTLCIADGFMTSFPSFAVCKNWVFHDEATDLKSHRTK